MNYPNVRFVFDRKKVSSINKTGLLQIEISYQRRRRWIGTGVHLLRHQWCPLRHVVRHNDSVSLNSHIDTMYTKVYESVMKLVRERRFSFEELDIMLAGKKEDMTFPEFIEDEIENKEMSYSRKRSCLIVLKRIDSFGLFQGFDTVTKQNVERFLQFLRNKKIKDGTVKVYANILSMFISKAVELGYMTSNPFSRIKVKRGESAERNFLTEPELERFENVETCGRIESITKDMFLLQCYTGMSFIDINRRNFKRIITDRNGKFVIADKRKKTSVSYYVVLSNKALEIIERNKFMFRIEYQKYNDTIKILAEKAGIEKKITSHCGRHTFAVIALNRGVPIEVLAKILGHSDIKTTQIYAKIVNKSVEEGFDKLEGIL